MRCHCWWCVDAIAWNQTPTKRICPSQPPHIFSSSARSHLNKFLFMVSVPTVVEQIFAYDFDGVFFLPSPSTLEYLLCISHFFRCRAQAYVKRWWVWYMCFVWLCFIYFLQSNSSVPASHPFISPLFPCFFRPVATLQNHVSVLFELRFPFVDPFTMPAMNVYIAHEAFYSFSLRLVWLRLAGSDVVDVVWYRHCWYEWNQSAVSSSHKHQIHFRWFSSLSPIPRTILKRPEWLSAERFVCDYQVAKRTEWVLWCIRLANMK